MTRRVFVTGGAGFVGRATVRQLRERGDEVTAIVRDPSRATSLRDLGVRLLAGDLGSVATIRAAMDGSDAAIHLAGSYRVGITAAERPQMYEANVAVARRVLDAAIVAGIPRMVHISSVNVFGNTHGRIVDETYLRDLNEGFLSHYDETKYKAHVAVEARISAGAPIVIILLGMVYGPGDHSAIGGQLKAAYDGTARYIAFRDLGISPTHVDDAAAGIVEGLERGRLGEAYIVTGDNLRLGEAMGVAARSAGRQPPRIHVPNVVLRLGSRIASRAGSLFGLDSNLKEIVSASDGVTYWASHAKATAELGYAPRPLSQGVVDAFGRG